MANKIGFNELVSLLSGSVGKSTMITFHSIADTDSISSAFALSKILKNSQIRVPDFMTSNSKFVLESAGVGLEMFKTGFMDDAELIVLVDVNNFDDCGNFAEQLKKESDKVVIIDHHAISDSGNSMIFNDERYNSTASIVYDIMEAFGIKPDMQTSELLIMGIYSDSAEFRNAEAKSFMQIGKLLDICGMDFQTLITKLSHIASPEARARTIDELFDAETAIRNGLLYVKGATSVHAAIAADDAVKIGADIALFYSESSSEVAFSARCRPAMDYMGDIHLGVVMKKAAKSIDGVGGGHPCAAGAYGPNKDGKYDFIKAFEDIVFGDKK